MHNNHNNNIGESPEKENYQLQKCMDCNFKLNRSLFTLVALFYLPSFSLAVWLFFFLPRFTHFFIHISFNNKIIMVLY